MSNVISHDDGPLLVAKGLVHYFRDQDGNDLQALGDVSFSADTREFVTVVGPSGCGKTTLLRILGGQLRPSRGEVWFAGERLSGPRSDIGFLFQKSNLMPWRTVLRNIMLPLEVAHIPKDEAEKRARASCQQVGLESFEKAYPVQLSGGMQQRVALARALVQRPRMLLLDEPFASLDAMTRERMNLELLRLWRKHGQTVIMVTHSITEAVFLADHVLVLTPRPAVVAAEVHVYLPRPRELSLLEGAEFRQLERRIRRAIERFAYP